MAEQEFVQLPDDAEAQNAHTQQILMSWLGLEGHGIPLRQTSVHDQTLFAGSFRNRGIGGLHLNALSSDGLTTIFEATDDGVRVSLAGEEASNAFVYPGMVVAWKRAASFIPAGWQIDVSGTGSFIYGASGDGEVGLLGGSLGVDFSHDHATFDHTHNGSSHRHDGSTNTDGSSLSGIEGDGVTGGSGTLTASTDTGIGTTHDGTGDGGFAGTGNTTDDGGSAATGPPSSTPTVQSGSGASVAGASHHHDMDGNAHHHGGPNHRHAGTDHAHTTLSHGHTIVTHTHTGSPHQHTTPPHAHNYTTGFAGTDTIGPSGASITTTDGSAVSVLPPYVRYYWIERLSA